MFKLLISLIGLYVVANAISSNDSKAWNAFKVRDPKLFNSFVQSRRKKTNSKYIVLKFYSIEIFFLIQLKYSKDYQNGTEENQRMRVFLDNKRTIDKHNDLYAKGHASYLMDINQYSDLTSDEFVNRMNGFKMPPTLS